MVKQKYERIAVGVGPHNGEPEWVSGKERGEERGVASKLSNFE